MVVSSYIIAGVTAWVISQGIKVTLDYKSRRLNTKNLIGFYRSGGMPSAHAASMVAITTVIGLADGINSGLFGLAVILTCIVMYDAVMVRRSSGLQGELLVKLVNLVDKGTKAPIFAKGHTPLEVAIGGLIGLIIGLVVFFATL